jgi:hypothetical protein
MVQLIFTSKPIFCNFLEFPTIKSIQNHYLSHISSKICEINSIKFDLPRASTKNTKNTPIFRGKLILLNFHWNFCSIINSFHTISPNNLKPNWFTLLIKSFTKIPKVWQETPSFGRSQCHETKQNKTNYLVS